MKNARRLLSVLTCLTMLVGILPNQVFAQQPRNSVELASVVLPSSTSTPSAPATGAPTVAPTVAPTGAPTATPLPFTSEQIIVTNEFNHTLGTGVSKIRGTVSGAANISVNVVIKVFGTTTNTSVLCNSEGVFAYDIPFTNSGLSVDATFTPTGYQSATKKYFIPADWNGIPTPKPSPSITIEVDLYKVFFYSTKRTTEYSKYLFDNAEKKAFWAIKKNLDSLKTKALSLSREFTIKKDEAIKKKCTLTDSRIKNIKKEYTSLLLSIYGTQKKVDEVIYNDWHISFASYLKLCVDSETINNLKTKSVAKIIKGITDAKAKVYYDKNKKKFDYVKVRHILYRLNDDNGDQYPADKRAEQKSKAAKMLERVKKGENMAYLAKKYSEDYAASLNHGLYKVAYDSPMVTEFKSWALNHKLGESGIVRSIYGFHVMKVEFESKTFAQNKAAVKLVLAGFQYESNIKYLISKAPTLIKNQSELDKITP